MTPPHNHNEDDVDSIDDDDDLIDGIHLNFIAYFGGLEHAKEYFDDSDVRHAIANGTLQGFMKTYRELRKHLGDDGDAQCRTHRLVLSIWCLPITAVI